MRTMAVLEPHGKLTCLHPPHMLWNRFLLYSHPIHPSVQPLSPSIYSFFLFISVAEFIYLIPSSIYTIHPTHTSNPSIQPFLSIHFLIFSSISFTQFVHLTHSSISCSIHLSFHSPIPSIHPPHPFIHLSHLSIQSFMHTSTFRFFFSTLNLLIRPSVHPSIHLPSSLSSSLYIYIYIYTCRQG